MKNWWKSFFKPVTADIMFKPREGKQTRSEVEIILREVGEDRRLRILDLACGEGRHSLLFANIHEVVGLDYSKDFLKSAKLKAAKLKSSARFVHGDMRAIPKSLSKESFDLVVSLYNSFGYFDKRSDDLKVLKEVHKALKPGGYFIVNTLNGAGVKELLMKPVSLGYEIEKNLFMLDEASVDVKKIRTTSKWTIIDARKAKAKIFRGHFGQNVYSHRELKALLKKAGFRIVKTWGPLHGGKFDEKTSWHQTVVARKVVGSNK